MVINVFMKMEAEADTWPRELESIEKNPMGFYN